MSLVNAGPLLPQSFEVSGTSTITAGTGADTLMTGMQFTTPAFGKYLALFSCDLNCSTAGAATSYSVYVGGTQIAETLIKVAPFDGGALSATSARCGVGINKVITVDGTQNVEIRWSASSGTNQSSARVFNLLRVA